MRGRAGTFVPTAGAGRVVLSVQVRATTVVEQSLSDLVHEADTLVVGTVSDLKTEWGGQAPHTLVTLSDCDTSRVTSPSSN